MKLVGRESQLATVHRAVEDVRRGNSRVLVVVGEPGIGKTALLESAAARAGVAGLLTLAGRAAEHEQEVPFALAVAALDDHVATLHPTRVETLGPALGAVLPAAAHGATAIAVATAAAERFRYHRALRGLVEQLARERPVALILDDLHWADDASLEFIQHLLRRPPRAPHLLVLALRSGHTPGRLLQTAAPAAGTEYVFLEPLAHADSLALLADLPDTRVRERIARDARGNPLFLMQLARFADLPAGTLPPCVLAAVALEVEALPADARALLQGAAVAGDPFDPELAAVAAELAPDAAPLDRLVAADLVRPTGNGRGFAFRHPVVLRAVYDAVPPAWSLGAHERIAEALAHRGAGVSMRAHHVERFARPGDEAAIALLTEAAAAAGEQAPATAARWYEAALRLVPDADAGRRVELRAKLALALAGAGRVREGRDTLVEVLASMPPAPTQERLALVAACAGMEKMLGRPVDARRRLLKAFAEAPPANRPALALQLASVETCFGTGRDIREWAARARPEPGSPDPALLAAAEAAGALGALRDHDPEPAHAGRERAATLLAGLDDGELVEHLDAFVHLGMAEVATERFADAAATAARGMAIARRTGQARVLVSLSVLSAVAHFELLDLDRAWQAVEDAIEGANLQDVAHLKILVLRARLPIYDLRGEWVEAAVAAEEFAELLQGVPESYSTLSGRAIAATLDVERDPGRCLRELVAAGGPLLERADVTQVTRLLLCAVRAALALGRVEDAERWAQRASDHAAELRLPAGAVRAACARAELLLARGEASRAAAVALGAVAAAERIGARNDEVVARLLAGRALAAAGNSEMARAELRQVADDARRGGAHALVGEAARELRRLGTRIPGPHAPAAGQSDAGDLTDRERNVSDLVVQGRSNKEVAAELYLSEKTIESTLTRVYAKLGVRSRVELTRRLTPA